MSPILAIFVLDIRATPLKKNYDLTPQGNEICQQMSKSFPNQLYHNRDIKIGSYILISRGLPYFFIIICFSFFGNDLCKIICCIKKLVRRHSRYYSAELCKHKTKLSNCYTTYILDHTNWLILYLY